MKAYTDIEQSKKLAEILPIETADMKWYFWKSEIDAPKLPTFGYSKTAAESYKDTEAVYLACWSFVALLRVLPSSTLDISDDHYCRLHCMERFTEWYDNAIDAAFEMIIKLHELNLL